MSYGAVVPNRTETNINVTRALAIDGFMSPQELMWLARQARDHCLIVEVGSYLGRSTRALLDNTNGVVYAFDDWRGPRELYLEKSERDSLYDHFCRNVYDHILCEKIEIYRGDHSTINFPRKVDMIFLDGNHDYPDVKRDILYWKDKLFPGGLLCGHDASWEGVSSAIIEVLGEVELVEDTDIWWTVKK